MRLFILLASVSVAIGFAASAAAQDFQNFQAADVVIGKPDFTTNTPTTPLTTNIGSTGDSFVDPTSGKLFVCDEGNNRVLRFSSSAAAANGAAAEAVFGQPDFVTGTANTGGVSATSMSDPVGIFVDSAGRLWVADSDNNRVLRFDGATGPVTLATLTADQVIGQPGFVTFAGGTTAIALSNPLDVWLDGSGNLWIADAFNNRVLRYDAVVGLGNGPAVTRVFGQGNAISGGAATSQTGMSNPFALCIDGSGNLWVADEGNNRVLRFAGAAAVALDGPAASGVLGQTLFTAQAPGLTQSGLNSPRGVSVNSGGRLWVSDHGNNRAVWFDAAATKADGGLADGVLGQPNFATGVVGLTQKTLDSPQGIFEDSANHLWISDTNNHRALRFTAPVPPAPKPPLISLRGSTKRTTTASKLLITGLSGDADGTVVAVKGNVNSGSYTTAKNISPWKFTARHLVRGEANHIKIRAIDNDGLKSEFVRVTVTRN
ncbi:MAG: NHL repeat-containing protein [Terrimicrobiaceae bacterium]|nr:NHL repeat-containing protein [Terrimicrobiaceae bacterium]